MKMKDKLKGYSTLDRDDKILEIANEIERMVDNGDLEVLDIYCADHDLDPVMLVSESTMEDIFNNELYAFFENQNHADHFSMTDYYTAKVDGWWNTYTELGDIPFLDNLNAVGEYILDNWADFEDYFDEDIFNDEVYDDEDEEEVAKLKEQGLI